MPVRSAQDVGSAFDMVGTRGVGVLMTDDTLLINQAERLASLAAERRLPAISNFRAFVAAGGLMSYGPSLAEQFQAQRCISRGSSRARVQRIFRLCRHLSSISWST